MNPNVTVTVDADSLVVLETGHTGGHRVWMTKEEARELASRLQEAAVQSGLMR